MAQATSQERPAIVHDPGLHTWPIETNLVFFKGLNKVMITAQCLLIRAVIQDGIERTHKSLLFLNAFPDLFETLKYIGDALVVAAEHNEVASVIHHRLRTDHMYNINMSRIVSKIIHFDYEDC